MQTSKNLPRQFWILFGGTLINSTGGGMVFPFLTLYLHGHLNLSMTYVGIVLLVWSASSLIGQIVGGTLTDQLGRKKLMALSLFASASVMLVFGFADSFGAALLIVLFAGFAGALYQPARDAMIADLIDPGQRTQAYGLIRIVANLGIAIGPAIGGFLAARSYLITFWGNAFLTLIFFGITIALIRETKPARSIDQPNAQTNGNFLAVLGDTRFVIFCGAVALCTILAGQMMAVLPVYMKDYFGLGESYFGWVMTTNAAMVVVLQYLITRATSRVPRLFLTTGGALLYALGVFSVALGTAFPHFILAMVIYTFGEMILVPTSTALTADFAPAEMRGRYMGMLGLTWSIGFGIGPTVGGLISDHIGPAAIWSITALSGVLAALIFIALSRIKSTRPAPAT
jgi:MFS family permease